MSQSHTLTDTDADVWLDAFELPLPAGGIRKRTLRGGLRDGVDVVDLDNGAFRVSVLPTRGMGLWRADYRGLRLGWDAPVRGPVHPKFVNQAARGGLGWLTGFDELLVRCGLASNGPPGLDGDTPLMLHGRIANLPAHRVDVGVDERGDLFVSGEVDEGGLFYPHFTLRTTYTTSPGSNVLRVRDEVTNRGGQPAELQLLYHINLGPPLLAAGSEVHLPVAQNTPLTDIAAAALGDFHRYGPPVAGFAEQVYAVRVMAGGDGRSVAVLHTPDAGQGVAVRWTAGPLPYCNVWKNTGAVEDGYVTGIEPATGFPRPRVHEREAGRVVTLGPGETWVAGLALEVLDSSERVAAVKREIVGIE